MQLRRTGHGGVAVLVLIVWTTMRLHGQSQASATLPVPDKPDFSGRWVLVSSTAAGPAAASMTVRQPIVRTNVFGAPTPPMFLALTVERQFANEVVTDSYRIGLEGGSFGPTPRNGDRTRVPESRVSVRWDGNRLVIDAGSYSGPIHDDGPWTEHSEIWQLDAAGMLILSITDRASGVPPTSNALTYRRI